MKVFFTFLGLSFSALLPLINPVGSALVFLGVVGPAPAEVYRDLARRVAITTLLYLVLVELSGATIMKFFGISLPVMQVAGGLVLAAMGWGLLSQDAPQPETAPGATARYNGLETLESQIFYPLTFPITAGPGATVVTITLSAHASAQHGLDNFIAHLGLAAAIAVLSVGVYICYAFAPRIAARINPRTAHGIQRVIAFVLLAIGVQITWNGLAILIRGLHT